MLSRCASRLHRVAVVLVLGAAVALPARRTWAAPGSPRTVIMVWTAPGIPESTVTRIHAAFAEQLRSRGELVPPDEVAEVLTARHKQAELCAFSEGCLISIARELRAPVAVKAEVRFSAGRLALGMTRYDTRTSAETGSASASLGAEEFGRAVASCMRQLFDPGAAPAADLPAEAEEDEAAPAQVPTIVIVPDAAPAPVAVTPAPPAPPVEQAPAPAPAAASTAPELPVSDSGPPAAGELPADAPELREAPPPVSLPREPSAPPGPEAPAGNHGVMVLQLQPIGVDAAAVAPFASVIAAQIATHPGYDVTSPEDVRRLMEQRGLAQATGCANDDDCLVQLSKKLKADLIVNGTVGRVGESYLLTLVSVLTADARASRRATATASRPQDLIKALPGCLDKLFGWGKATVAAFHLPKAKHMSFAVFALKPTGLTPETAANLTHVLTTEVKGIDGASVVSKDDIAAMLQLQAARQKTGCDDPSCMMEIGGLLGVERLITGDAGKVGSLYLVNLRLIDVRQGIVENRVTESFEGNEEQLLRSVRFAARNLLGISEAAKGDMAVTASQNAADVFVDEAKPLRTPAHLVDLSAGKHTVRVAAHGYFDWHGDVYVDPHETTSIWTQLSARPQAWYQKWWVWTIAGTFLAGGAATAVLVTRTKPMAGVVGVSFQ